MKDVMRHAFAGLVVVVAGMLLAPCTRAQAPISPGEAHTTKAEAERITVSGMLAGRVVDPSGAALPGVTIEVVAPDGSRTMTITDADGSFRLPGLPNGPAVLKASLVGFASVQRQVTVAAGQSTQIMLTLGGPVSPGNPGDGGGSGSSDEQSNPPEPAAGPTVVERRISDDIVLQDWLNQETAKGWELDAIVAVEPGTSLFVFERQKAAAASIVIVDLSAELDPARLATRIGQHPGKRFLGIHRLGPGVAALVFRDGP